MPEAKFCASRLDSSEKPFFGDLIYMGPMTERSQVLALEHMQKHKSALINALESGKHFLFTGNALELMGEYIECGSEKLECLGIFSYYAKRNMNHRHNSLYIGRFNPNADTKMDIVGFRSQFSFCKGEFGATWLETKRGVGLMGTAESGEGVHIANFIGTYLLGPILPLNPDFTSYLMRELGCNEPVAFESVARAAYEQRLSEFWTVNPPKH